MARCRLAVSIVVVALLVAAIRRLCYPYRLCPPVVGFQHPHCRLLTATHSLSFPSRTLEYPDPCCSCCYPCSTSCLPPSICRPPTCPMVFNLPTWIHIISHHRQPLTSRCSSWSHRSQLPPIFTTGLLVFLLYTPIPFFHSSLSLSLFSLRRDVPKGSLNVCLIYLDVIDGLILLPFGPIPFGCSRRGLFFFQTQESSTSEHGLQDIYIYI